MKPIGVEIVSLPDPTFHWLNFGYALLSGLVGGLVIFLLNKLWEHIKNKSQYKKLVTLLVYELYIDLHLIEMNEILSKNEPLNLRNVVWENNRITITDSIKKEVLLDLDYIYIAIEINKKRTIEEMESDIIFKIELEELKNVIDNIIKILSMEVGIEKKQLEEMIKRFQIKYEEKKIIKSNETEE